jgi:hypothetical protein
MMDKITIRIFLTITISTLFFAIPALSYSPFSDEIQRKYSVNARCEVCHTTSGLNSFGIEFKNLWQKDKKNLSKNLELLESEDSDQDGYSNYKEILSESLPGDKFSKPLKNEELQKSH